MSQSRLFVLALVVPGLLMIGCSNASQDKSATRTAAPATVATAADAPTPATLPPADGDLVDLATDESCRKLALQVIRQQDRKADRVFLDDATPAGGYRRDGNAISGDHGQYRTDAGWTALASFRCTVDDAGNAISFDYQAGKAQTWADMSEQH